MEIKNGKNIMKKFKVIAYQAVQFSTIIEAESEVDALNKANEISNVDNRWIATNEDYSFVPTTAEEIEDEEE